MVSAEAPAQQSLAELEARLAQVTSQLTEVAGDVSLCMISRSTGPVDGAKYLEGRMAVLVELKRAIRRGPQAPLASIVDPVARQWRSDLQLQRERGATRGWVAYRAGGVDELEDLLGGD